MWRKRNSHALFVRFQIGPVMEIHLHPNTQVEFGCIHIPLSPNLHQQPNPQSRKGKLIS